MDVAIRHSPWFAAARITLGPSEQVRDVAHHLTRTTGRPVAGCVK